MIVDYSYMGERTEVSRFQGEVGANHQITIPIATRKMLGVEPGDLLDLSVIAVMRKPVDAECRLEYGMVL